MIVTRKPEDDYGDATLGAWNKPGDDYHLLVDGTVIGSTWWCGADYVNDGQRWASCGPAGLETGFRTREAAEQVQVDAYAADPARFDELAAQQEQERAESLARRNAEVAAVAQARTYARRTARLGTDEPGPTVFSIPEHHHTYGDEAEVNAVAAWLAANSVEADTRYEIRVEQRAKRTVIVFEKPAYGSGVETHVVTMIAAPSFSPPVARPDVAALLNVHSQSLFPLLNHATPACGLCTPAAGRLVPWLCPTVTAAISAPLVAA